MRGVGSEVLGLSEQGTLQLGLYDRGWSSCVLAQGITKVLIRVKDNRWGLEMSENAFLLFWQAYPRRVGKRAAMKSFEKSLKIASVNEIIEGAKNYAIQVAEKGTELQYVKHPTTWLNQGCWEDEYELNVKRVEQLSPEESRWKARIQGWLSRKAWIEDWGPPPDAPDTRCPKHIILRIESLEQLT